MIQTHALVKRFGHVVAVDGIDLDVRQGDRYGFLGPNGSGKTTTVRMLLGLVLPTSGSVHLLGSSKLTEQLPRVGALVEGPAAYGHLSGRANLALLDAAGPGARRRTRKARLGAALEQVGLGGVDRRPVKHYSLGMQQRLGLAAALLRAPVLLVLDEPTNGLDPRGIREIRELLLTLNAAGTTIFLSSHLLSEVEALCTRVGVLDQGRLVAQGALRDFQQPTGRVLVRTPDVALVVGLFGARAEALTIDQVAVTAPDAAALNATLVGEGVRVQALLQERHSLEQTVLAATSTGSDRIGRGA